MNERTDIFDIEVGDVEAYVTSTLHAPITLRPWSGAAVLPQYLRQRYRFFEGRLLGVPVLWAVVQDADLTPKTVLKHVAALSNSWQDRVVVVFGQLASYDRLRLTQYGINFVVPGTQLYLLDMGIDFRSRKRHARRPLDVVLRPSAQVLLLHLLLSEADASTTAAEMARGLGYTKMTMTRAVAQLEDAALIQVVRTGRSNAFRLAGSRRQVWEAAQDRLGTPVLRIRKIPFAWDGPEPEAGLTALAKYTMLSEPPLPVRAIGHERAGEIARFQDDSWLQAHLTREENEVQVEVWSYDPKLLSSGPEVDRLSLYLSLRDDSDERVQGALEELLKALPW